MMSRKTESGLLGKLFALMVGAALLVLGFMFSILLLAVVVIGGLGAWGYLWWKTRALRKAMREHPPIADTEGRVIDGEVIVMEDDPTVVQNVLPREQPEK